VLSRLLKQARIEAGLTLTQVAAAVMVSQSQLSRIETGAASLSSERLVALAGIYGVSPSRLLDGAVVKSMSDMDLDRIGQVIEFVEVVLQDVSPRPAAKQIRTAVLAIFRHESAAAFEAGRPFNAESYRGNLLSMLAPPEA
jgi:transcriptional regulator with XRE-family HTH domain